MAEVNCLYFALNPTDEYCRTQCEHSRPHIVNEECAMYCAVGEYEKCVTNDVILKAVEEKKKGLLQEAKTLEHNFRQCKF